MYSANERILATHGQTFHFAARFLPPGVRPSVVTLYAFFRTLDDLVDEPETGRGRQDVYAELHAWRDWLVENHSRPAPREPLGADVAALITGHQLPIPLFLDFLDGVLGDLEPRQVRDVGELHRYCYAVAGTVGLAMARLLGAASPQALAAAESLGIAMQRTNILRDVGGDLESGRIYLPQDELARFGLSSEHLYQLWKERNGPDEQFRALIRAQIAQTHRYYAHGIAGIWLLPQDCRLPILLAARLYRRILLVIERNHYDVLRWRAATSFPEKLWEAGVTFALDRLWRRGEARPYAGMEVACEE
ncbi:MAG TPA: phytoene/squalene synthase family protein [Ktedonobacterales bacterium]|nr:phytoene/squalene synthase family protein [Ktedonobacterales bacterium]